MTLSEMVGPLSALAGGFDEHLVCLGYGPKAARGQRELFAEASAWLDGHDVVSDGVEEKDLRAVLTARRERGVDLFDPSALAAMIDYLALVGVEVRPALVSLGGAAGELVGRFAAYLSDERGLAPKVVSFYVSQAEGFVEAVAVGGDVGSVTVGDVVEFMARASRERSRGSVGNLVAGLRAFLRFAFIDDLVATDLSVAVPTVIHRRDQRLPVVLSPKDVERLIGSCDLRRSIGRRDRAILVLLARLALRAGEVASLTLDDIDWAVGEIQVQGKGPRTERLPLPADVGEAVVGYLQRGRPQTPSRAVFVRAIAPRVALSPAGVSWVVNAACARADIGQVSAHSLRHSAASHMLAGGATMAEVGQVLRHRKPHTTATYARVDQCALTGLARPWPKARP